MQSKTFEVKLDNFKGPLHVLLELIEKRKLSINEVSLSEVTDEFISLYQKEDKDFLADFIVIASTLILIKSRSLMPEIPLTHEEEMESEDLQTRLKALQALKKQSAILSSFVSENSRLFDINLHKDDELYISFDFPPNLSVKSVQYAMEELLRSTKQEDNNIKVKRRKFKDLQQVMKDLLRKLRNLQKISFKEISGKTKEDKLVSFLAILELARREEVILNQNKNDIIVESVKIDTPYYG